MEPAVTCEHVHEAARSLASALPGGFAPRAAIVCGSGLGALADSLEDAHIVEYRDVPHMPEATAPGHCGRFVAGTLSASTDASAPGTPGTLSSATGGIPVICMQGRLHAYEGHSAQEIALPIWVMHELGAEVLVATNAAGGIDPSFDVGDLMLVTDHINLTGLNPCVGSATAALRDEYFFDMTDAYDPALCDVARAAARAMGMTLREGTYLMTVGPSFETPAEISAFSTLGASAVGMSTVLETIAARSCGMRVLAVSLITNAAAGVGGATVSADDVECVAQAGSEQMSSLVMQVVGSL